MPRKLLLADDSITIQRVIELTFADEDIQVIAVGDGQQAIARIDADRPDVVLADIGMPERDGYEVAAHVKGNPQTANIPVLLLTGAFEPIDEARARSVGCDGVLVKPFEPQMVINRVKDLLAGRRPASLWSTPPGPTGTVVAPHGGASGPVGIVTGMVPPPPAQPAPAIGEAPGLDSLDEYFDRLDAAFRKVSRPRREAKRPCRWPRHHGRLRVGSRIGIRELGYPDGAETRCSAARGGSSPAVCCDASSTRRPARTSAAGQRGADNRARIVPSRPATRARRCLRRASRGGAAICVDDSGAGDSALPRAAGATNEAAIEPSSPSARGHDRNMVRTTVLDVAERLVRAEIDKIKQQAKL
jgi:CheY-like chemotaxis protein